MMGRPEGGSGESGGVGDRRCGGWERGGVSVE
jgi:hypothetical protein